MPAPMSNLPEFSVSEISQAIKRTMEETFGHVRLRGEISGFRGPHSSGHCYFSLKDQNSKIDAIVWRGNYRKMERWLEEGLEVIATGKVTTYPAKSGYQIVIDSIEPAGVGALLAQLEERRKKLAAEGLFDAERKRALPYLPRVIGVVTSPTGAVIRDILHRIADRFPVRVLVWPVRVQGDGAAEEVARGIAGMNALAETDSAGERLRPDILIVARGGGSLEDLWAFNEEVVVRAAAGSAIPLISAVGHETDTTLIDFVADRRAPTPTAAAELAVPVRMELMAGLEGQGARLSHAATQVLSLRGQRLRDLSRALPKPATLVESARQRLDSWGDRLGPSLSLAAQRKRVQLSEASASLRPAVLRRLTGDARRRLDERAARLDAALLSREIDRKARDLDRVTQRLSMVSRGQIAHWRQKLDGLDRTRQTLGYRETLKRGYAVVRSGEQVITTRAEAEKSPALEIEFQDGRLKIGGSAPKSGRAKPEPPEQGSLF